MRNISCRHTVRQIMEGTKTETRRLGWKNVQRGELLQTIVKGQGLKKGETVEKLRVIRVDYTWRESLLRLTDNISYVKSGISYGERCVAREGFPEMTPAEFVEFFCRSHKGCTPETEVTVIGFDYVAAIGDWVEVSPLVSGRSWTGRVECFTGSGTECKIVGKDGQYAYLHQFALAGFKVLPRVSDYLRRVSNEDDKMVDK